MYYSDALESIRRTNGARDPDCALLLNSLGICHRRIGDYEKAIACYLEAWDIFREQYGEEHPYCAACLNNLGGCYYHLGDYDQAMAYHSRTLEIYRALYGEEHPDYAMSLENLGACCIDQGDYGKAVAYYEQALKIYQAVYGERNLDAANSLNNLGVSLSKQGDYRKAKDCWTEALEINRTFMGDRHPDYLINLQNLADCNYHLGDYPAYKAQTLEYKDRAGALVLDAFTYLSQQQRAFYWDLYSRFYLLDLPQAAMTLSSDREMLSAAYDGALFSKGLLLNAETELRKLILESDDPEVLALYDRFLAEKTQLDELRAQPIAERQMPADSLEEICARLEKSLQQRSRAFGDYTKKLSIDWKDVRSRLGKRDIAVEFLEVPVSPDSTYYYALTLKKGYDVPHFVPLFELKDLHALRDREKSGDPGQMYQGRGLYDLVWKPLESEFKGAKNIYFSPCGELYQLAVEYADDGKGPLSDRKNVHRLSSTRQLARDRNGDGGRRSAVFGGLKYGAADVRTVDSLFTRGAVASRAVRDLPGTESEAREIDALLRAGGFDNTLLLGTAGTESAFKALSGRQENIIHVATHGFCWDGRQERKGTGRGRNGADNKDIASGQELEDVSMTRSGLLFSGANNALQKGYRKQEGVDDGILTAKEVAQLDLRGTDLLVLSACQTGLGRVSGEGVFGLQRGFKKAGVNTILMSLWEVDDSATRLLMTTFYEAIESGQSKTAALKAAQAAVKGCREHDYASPYYWAAFILLDDF